MNDESRYYKCKCPRCGWKGSSKDAAGGESIADTGDFNDPICPECIKFEKYIYLEEDEE